MTPGEFVHFSGVARGSLLELETQLDIAADLAYIQQTDLQEFGHEIYEVLGLLNRLIESQREKRMV